MAEVVPQAVLFDRTPIAVRLGSDVAARRHGRYIDEMGPTVSIDRSAWPIVQMRFVGDPTLVELEASLRVFDEILRDRQKYVLILDVADVVVVGAALRHRSARWLIDNGPLVIKLCVGVICVATSPLARAAVTAMEWLDPRGDRYAIVGTLDEALELARQRITDSRPANDEPGGLP